ncbi:hypothetical protein BHE74_00002483 [Ensete ventricosum]|nr:hypothetical protein BHE74_00002483 [Ensete ventricosum]
MPLYFTSPSVVLVARRASYFLQLRRADLPHLTCVRSVVQLLTPPCLCQAGSTVSGRPRWRASCPRARGRDNQVRMTSSNSSSSVRVTSSPGSRGASLGDPEASPSGASTGPPSPVDTRVLRDLEVMKADHDLDTAVTEGSLAVTRERYSISAEYGLHVPWSRQRPYSSDAPGVCISMDALEAGLWFPLHPLIEECIRWYWMDLDDLRGMPKVSEGKTPSVRAAVPAQEVGISPAREAPKTSSKRPIDTLNEQTDDPARRHKKVKILSRRHKSCHGESRSHSKGKEPVEPVEEPETLGDSVEEDASSVFHRPRSMKDLFKTKVHKDDAGYYALHMSDLAHKDPEKEMQLRWEGLKYSTKVRNDPSTVEEFERGLLHPQLARELYTLPSEVLLARVTKEMVLVSSRPSS